jgi:methylthioribulose-1-phosphate dehydratase
MTAELSEVAAAFAQFGRDFYRRGWVLGTSGNFSAVVSREPFRLAITSTGADKGALTPQHILQIDDAGRPTTGAALASAEARLHLVVARARPAAAVLHTHSVWGTIVSEAYADDGGVGITGYEMLKGLEGVRTHEHREWLPVIDNSQDWDASSRLVEEMLERHPESHGFLIRRHGLYTWGRSLAEAKRHVEILEFLMEVTGRTYCAHGRDSKGVRP